MSELPDPKLHERPVASNATAHQPETREGIDAACHPALQRDPADEDAKLDVALDETFPSSDPPSTTQPGRGSEPAPSSGFRDPKSDELPLDAE